MRVLRKSLLLLLFASLFLPKSIAQTDVQLRISAKKCVSGTLVNPPAMWIGVFDASKVTHMLELVQAFRQNSNPPDSSGAEKMLDVFNSLERESRSAPALYRSKKPVSGQKLLKVSSVQRLVIVAFGSDEGELTSFAEQVVEPKPGTVTDIAMNFSSETECPK